MKIQINGTTENISPRLTIAELLTVKELPAATVVVELNGTIISGDTFAETVLQPDDTLEILRFVGGG